MCPRSVKCSTNSEGDFATVDFIEGEVTPEQIQAAIARLPPDHRDLLKLHLIDGLSVCEIAQRRERSPGLARRRVARSYGFIRHALMKHRQSASDPTVSSV